MREAATRATSALEAAKDVPTFQARLKLRHPLAVYNISISQVVSRFLSALKSYQQLFLPYGANSELNTRKSEFIESLDSLLDALIEHIDDSNNVIRCFFDADSDPKYKKIYSQFKSSIRPYRDQIGKVVNKIKHEQGRLRPVSFSWPNGNCYGYFVEGADQEGAIGPDKSIHEGGNTAFSVARDFRLHVCGIYFVGTHLAQAIYEISGVGVPRRHVADQGAAGLAEVIKMVSEIPPIFFPDEIKKHIPSVKVTGSGALIACGDLRHEKVSVLPRSNVNISFVGDGVSRTFRMPYFNGNSL